MPFFRIQKFNVAASLKESRWGSMSFCHTTRRWMTSARNHLTALQHNITAILASDFVKASSGIFPRCSRSKVTFSSYEKSQFSCCYDDNTEIAASEQKCPCCLCLLSSFDVFRISFIWRWCWPSCSFNALQSLPTWSKAQATRKCLVNSWKAPEVLLSHVIFLSPT